MVRRSHLLALGSLATLLGAGCSVTLPEAARRGDRLMAAGDTVGAESAYAAAMREPLTYSEFDAVVERRCEARRLLHRAQLTLLKATGEPQYAAAEAIRKEARRCPGFAEFEDEVWALRAGWAEDALKRQVDPLIAQGRRLAALREAGRHTPYLPPQHPRAASLASLRAEVVADLDQRARDWPEDSVVKALLNHFARQVSRGESSLPATLLRKLEPRITVSPSGGSTPVEVPQSVGCTVPLSPQAISLGPAGVRGQPYALQSVTVELCSQSTSVERFQKVETRYRTEKRRVKRTEPYTVPVRTANTSVVRSCGQNKSGFSGCSTVSSSTTWTTTNETRTREVWVDVEEQVPYEVTLNLKRPRIRASLAARFEVRYGEQRVTRRASVSFEETGTEVDVKTPDAPLSAARLSSQGAATLTSRLVEAIRDEAAKVARTLRTAELNRELDVLTERGDRRALTEYAATLWALGALTHTEGARALGEAVGGDPAVGAPVGAPGPEAFAVSPFEWARDEVITDNYFEFNPDALLMSGLIAYGYPYATAGFGVGTLHPPQGLVGQPNRNGLLLSTDGSLRWSFMSGHFHRGVGVMLGMDFRAGGGFRLGADYQRLTELPVYALDKDEPELDAAFHGEVAAVGLVGWRGGRAGVFVGVRPMYTLGRLGHYTTTGGAIPLMGRFELRLNERYPIISELWFGDLSGAGRDNIGGSIDLPIDSGRWLRFRYQSQSLGARFYGLNEADPVWLSQARLHEFGLFYVISP